MNVPAGFDAESPWPTYQQVNNNVTKFNYANEFAARIGFQPPSMMRTFNFEVLPRDPPIKFQQQEENTFYAATSPLKVAAYRDGTGDLMHKGEMLFCTDAKRDATTGSHIYRVFPIWKFLQGCRQRAIDEGHTDSGGLQTNKRQNTGSADNAGMPGNEEPESAWSFPLTGEEYRRRCAWAGVLSQWIPNNTGSFLYQGFTSDDSDGVYRLASLEEANRVQIPIMTSDPYLRTGCNYWRYARISEQRWEASWDPRGNKLGSNICVRSVEIMHAFTWDNAQPPLEPLAEQVVTEFTVNKLPTDPVTGAPFPWATGTDPLTGKQLTFQPEPVSVSVKTLDVVHCEKVGKILRIYEGGSPSEEEALRAAYTHEGYHNLQRLRCVADVHLLPHCSLSPYSNSG